MKFEIKSRWSMKTIFECELDVKFDNSPEKIRLGEAIKNAVLRGADLSGAVLRDADLRDAVLRENLEGVPFIKDIHQTVYNACTVSPDALDMVGWHKCETTHCRAGWVVTLAGEGGKALKFAMGTPAAAAIIYLKSDPKLEKMPDFYCSNEEALADMKRLADAERDAA